MRIENSFDLELRCLQDIQVHLFCAQMHLLTIFWPPSLKDVNKASAWGTGAMIGLPCSFYQVLEADTEIGYMKG